MALALRQLKRRGAALGLQAALAILATDVAVADPVGPTSIHPSCGLGFETVRTTDANVRLLQLTSLTSLPAVALKVRLDSATTAYTYATAPLAIDHARADPVHGPIFVSLPMQISIPADASITDAAIEGSSTQPTTCDLAQVMTYASEPTGLATVTVDVAKALRPEVATLEPPTCRVPFKDSAVDGRPFQPDYPIAARQQGMTGTATVMVTLDATGAVTNTTISSSSGHASLDESARYAASRTRYTPDVVRCVPVAGRYMFSSNFQRASQ